MDGGLGRSRRKVVPWGFRNGNGVGLRLLTFDLMQDCVSDPECVLRVEPKMPGLFEHFEGESQIIGSSGVSRSEHHPAILNEREAVLAAVNLLMKR